MQSNLNLNIFMNQYLLFFHFHLAVYNIELKVLYCTKIVNLLIIVSCYYVEYIIIVISKTKIAHVLVCFMMV